jgi:8-hydroxy-5-deazaflavin:NADPH oxidoreductase
MKIGIIGAGKMSDSFVRRFRAVGHDVVVSNSRGPEALRDFASQTGAEPGTVWDAVRGADVVIVAIPEKNVSHLPKSLFAGVRDTVPIVDTGNYYPKYRDGWIEQIEGGMTDSGWVAQELGRPVVKAFNNIYARHIVELAKPNGTPGRIALPVAGDDQKAKAVVMQLIDEIGFDPVDAGTIAESWRDQPGSPVYCMDYDADGVRRALSEGNPEHRWEAFRIQDEEAARLYGTAAS